METLLTCLARNKITAPDPIALEEMLLVANVYSIRAAQIELTGTVDGNVTSDGGATVVAASLKVKKSFLLQPESSFTYFLSGLVAAAAIIEQTAMTAVQSSGIPGSGKNAVMALDTATLATLVCTVWAAQQKIDVSTLLNLGYAFAFSTAWVQYLKNLHG